ncbi:MAG: sodium:phosphate symporter, partial [Gammaproteobacteria bacterium]
METTNTTAAPAQSGGHAVQWFGVLALVYLLICAVSMIGGGFKMAAGEHAKELF